MRGELEENCLKLINKYLDEQSFFAMSWEEIYVVKDALAHAGSNPKRSEFPDFVFEGGFIEHFQVSSSFENRKGSTMAREKNKVNRDFINRVKEAEDSTEGNKITLHTIDTTPYWHSQHSYENFADSFKKNLKHHLESLKKYNGAKDIKIFMIEYVDSALRMKKKYPRDLMLEVAYGDLLKKENPAYRLSRDIDMLRYIFENRDKIDFIVFVNKSCFDGIFVDIIKAQNALEIVKLLYDGYEFHCASVGTTQFGIGVACPKIEGDTEDE